jgi:hypothetical protein
VQFDGDANGKLERFHRTLKSSAIRPKTPLNLEDARRVAGEFIEHYNQVRLHSAIGYIAPADRLAGRHEAIWAARDRKLAEAREARRRKRAGEIGSIWRLEKPRLPVNHPPFPRRVGQRRDATRAPRMTRIPQAWAVATPPRPATCGIDPKATNPRGFGGQSPPKERLQTQPSTATEK